MTTREHAMLTRWLDSPDPVDRAHARARLAMDDARGVESTDADADGIVRESASDLDAARAAALIAEFPPETFVRVGGCCNG